MRLARALLAATIALAGLTTGLRAAELFSEGPGSSDFSIFPGWQRVMTQTSTQIAPASKVDATALCPTGTDCKLSQWKAFLKETAKLPRDKQLEAVNTWANAHPYVEDWASWGLPDYWETPAEFLARGGDCEDYAIIKYFSLIQLGFQADEMRILVVNDINLGIFHAVLAVHKKDAPTVLLDNQVAQVVPMALASHYVPIYSLNEKGWWMAPQTPVATNVDFEAKSVFAAAGR